MNRITIVLLACLLGQSVARAAESETPFLDPPDQFKTTTLSHAITVEAGRLAKSESMVDLRAQSSPATNNGDTRPWCVRHGTGCFALIGYAVGFIGGLMHPPEDFVPEGWALVFSGPIGAAIGAAVGWCIAEGTKPVPKPQQQP